jgi:hypothetical protein
VVLELAEESEKKMLWQLYLAQLKWLLHLQLRLFLPQVKFAPNLLQSPRFVAQQ